MTSSSSKSTVQDASVPSEAIPYDYSGADVKSVLINVTSIAVFIEPFFIYYLFGNDEKYLFVSRTMGCYGSFAILIVMLCLAYFAPPVGWRKPHPYSDDETNVPYYYRTKKH